MAKLLFKFHNTKLCLVLWMLIQTQLNFFDPHGLMEVPNKDSLLECFLFYACKCNILF